MDRPSVIDSSLMIIASSLSQVFVRPYPHEDRKHHITHCFVRLPPLDPDPSESRPSESFDSRRQRCFVSSATRRSNSSCLLWSLSLLWRESPRVRSLSRSSSSSLSRSSRPCIIPESIATVRQGSSALRWCYAGNHTFFLLVS